MNENKYVIQRSSGRVKNLRNERISGLMRGILCRTLSDINNIIMRQSIPAAPSAQRPAPSAQPPPPPGSPPGIGIFFALDGKFPGVGTLQLSNPPG